MTTQDHPRGDALTARNRLLLRSPDGDGRLRGYLVLAQRNRLLWRVLLTLEPSGDDWRARQRDDSLAALVFSSLRLG